MLTGLVTLSTASGQDLAIRADVLAGIQQASASTGIDFAYLMAQANRESSFNPTAQAKSSSAAGLYQFIEQTWLGVVKGHGAEHGRADLAEQITRRADGRFVVSDAGVKQEILDLRRDPAFAAAMAAEHASDNKAKLEERLGRPASGTDLYLAHFLGISGAIKFLRNHDGNPERTGASLFPKAAATNPSVFYDAGGRARTVSEIYDKFAQSLNADMKAYAGFEDSLIEAPAIAVAAATPAPAAVGTYPGMIHPAGALALSSKPGSVTNAGVAEVRGFNRVGGLLSPLMLVTLAALPVGRDDDKDDKSRNLLGSDQPSAGGVQGLGLFGNDGGPLDLGIIRSAFAV